MKSLTLSREAQPSERDLRVVMAGAAVLTASTTLWWPGVDKGAGWILWTPLLAPMFVLACQRGRSGALRGLAFAGLMLLGISGAGAATETQWARWDQVMGVALVYALITAATAWLAERLRAETRAEREIALTDSLTGLPNRRHAGIFMDAAVAGVDRGGWLTVVLFDLDHFKRFNDSFGHEGGDRVLRIFSEVLEGATRRSNLSARVGGEEFLTILTDCNLHGGIIFAERLRAMVKERASRFGLTVSAGVATLESSAGTQEDLLAAADEALYQAKAAGRDCVRASSSVISLSSLMSPTRRVFAA